MKKTVIIATKNMDSGAKMPEFKFQLCHLLAGSSWASYSTLSHLVFSSVNWAWL